MTKRRAAKIVGVIFSRADFQRAIRMRNPPDLFELRLDALAGRIELLRKGIGKLPAPFIITARHPQEGGAHQLSSRDRRKLLLAFLPNATAVDIELRSAGALAAVLRAAQSDNIRVIISYHDFRGTPDTARLGEIVRAAQSLGADLVKIATRTDTPLQFERLLYCFAQPPRNAKVIAMGIGKLGRAARLELARRGCALNYAHLGKAQVAGQLSISDLRRALR